MVNLYTVNPSFFNLAAESLATQWNKDIYVHLPRTRARTRERTLHNTFKLVPQDY